MTTPLWESINLNRDYDPIQPEKIDRSLTVLLRRAFNQAAENLATLIGEEKNYISFLRKRALVHPRCFFTKTHDCEVHSDMVQLHKMKMRLTAIRDRVVVVGKVDSLQEITVLHLWMPDTDDEVNVSELGSALNFVANA